MNEFETMKKIGQLYGVTSHAIGRKLKELGFRTAEGRPSSKAFDLGLVEQKWTQDHANYLWAWHTVKTTRLLEQAGMTRLVVNNPVAAGPGC